MLFNCLPFWVFFAAVYLLYRLSGRWWGLRPQNTLLLAASYVFYAAWDWRFLSLLLFSTVLDHFCARWIHRSRNPVQCKFLLWLSIGAGLGILGFFKYAGFFTENLSALLGTAGIRLPRAALEVVLPVGISFYTFQTMGYVIDVYRRKTAPAESLLDFALFVAFFPQLVAGPIEKASHLLPQIVSVRKITAGSVHEGVYLILWGLFQKVFVADNLARLVDPFFASQGPYAGASVLIAVYAFSFQIYCDFAGYSNIARGLGLLMGFDLMVNFNLPFFSKNPRELWERWHISLSVWVRDYIYTPTRSVLLTMTLMGLWHGAAWTYVLWGFYHGGLLWMHRRLTQWRKGSGLLPAPLKIIGFFHLWCLGALVFRCGSLSQLGAMLEGLLLRFEPAGLLSGELLHLVYFTFFLVAVETLQYAQKDLLAFLRWPLAARTAMALWAAYLMLYTEILGGNLTSGEPRAFIYFQF